MSLKIILIRHGESDGNAQGRFCGFRDVDLTEKGVWQAERLAYRLKGSQFDKIYCSDLKRARCTTEIAFKSHGIEIISSSNLREMNFGIWEGHTFEEIKEKNKYGEEFISWLKNPKTIPAIPQGENFIDFKNRVIGELDRIIKEHYELSTEKPIAIVSHGGAIRIILCNVLNLDMQYMWKIEQSPSALNIIDYYDGKGFISLINDTSHLENWWEEGMGKV